MALSTAARVFISACKNSFLCDFFATLGNFNNCETDSPFPPTHGGLKSALYVSMWVYLTWWDHFSGSYTNWILIKADSHKLELQCIHDFFSCKLTHNYEGDLKLDYSFGLSRIPWSSAITNTSAKKISLQVIITLASSFYRVQLSYKETF